VGTNILERWVKITIQKDGDKDGNSKKQDLSFDGQGQANILAGHIGVS
jgi:hypothetical protein